MDSSLKSNLLHRQLKESKSSFKSHSPKNEFYHTPHAEKKLCIVWDTGREMLFYYSYLISVDLDIEDEMNVITLRFMMHCIKLKGYNLAILFKRFMRDEPHIITITNPRYISHCSLDESVVIDAIVEK